jgi:hypothetical protein
LRNRLCNGKSRIVWNGFSGEGTKRYRGFEAGNAAITIGRIVDDREGRAIEAEFIFGGTRNQYIAYQRATTSIAPIAGLIAGGIGMAMILGGIWYSIRGG